MIGGFMINYGVVGVGYFGAELARFMNMHDNAKITCVYDPENGENIARELQCINMSSLDALVSSKLVDCVIVATPNYLPGRKEVVRLSASLHQIDKNRRGKRS